MTVNVTNSAVYYNCLKIKYVDKHKALAYSTFVYLHCDWMVKFFYVAGKHTVRYLLGCL